MAVRLLPSTEVVVVGYLRSVPEVSALVGDRVATTLYAGGDPLVYVSMPTGSERVPNYLVAPMIDIQCYGGSKGQADVLDRTVRAAMDDMRGVRGDAVVTDVGLAAGPIWMPDTEFTPARARYVRSYIVTLHPTPA